MSKFKGLKEALELAGKAAKKVDNVPLKLGTTDAETFHKALSAAQASDPKIKQMVHLYNPEEYKDMRLMLDADGRGGYALKPDGDIVSVFSLKGGEGDNLVQHAIDNGGTKLDAFDGYLTKDLYPRNGFKEVKREANWTPGEPDVVYMDLPQNFKKIREMVPNVEAQKLLRETDPQKYQQYLNELDNAYGPKDARSKAMGFGKEKYYHGTPKDFEAFDVNKAGSTTDVNTGKAAWVTDSPDVAGEYADYALQGQQIMPLRVRKGNVADESSALNPDGRYISPGIRKKKVEHHFDEGADTVDFGKLIDDPSGEEKVSNILAVKDGSQLRSPHAAYDPRFKKTGNILAGAAGVTAAGTLLGGNEAKADNGYLVNPEMQAYLDKENVANYVNNLPPPEPDMIDKAKSYGFKKLGQFVNSGTGQAVMKGLDYLDRPASAMRHAAYETMNPESSLGDIAQAAKEGFTRTGKKDIQGTDIAERMGEAYGIENPYALGAIATAADLADPVDLAGVGLVGKAGKAVKAAGNAAEQANKFQKIQKLYKIGNKYTGERHVMGTAADAMTEKARLVGEGLVSPDAVIRSLDD